jgi:hypothetical protein
MHYVYVLGNNEFLENCNKYIKDKSLSLSTTTDVELFKNQITKTNDNNFFIVIDSDKIGNYNKKMIFFGRELITYKWLKNADINPDSFVSFDLNKYSDIEKRILEIINKREVVVEVKKENNLIKEEINYVEKDIEDDEDLDFDIDSLIDEANKSDFDKNEVEEAVNKVVESHSSTLDMKDIAVETKKTNEFSSKKMDIRGPDVDSDDDKVSDDDIDELMKQFANTKEDTPSPKNKIKKNTVAQNLVETLGEDKTFEMFEAGEL